jgi:hypothetical protein
MVVECLLVAEAATVAAIIGVDGLGRYAIIAVLALAMGCRNATVRELSVADMTTTVLTMTLTSLAADSVLAGGSSPRTPRRVAAVAAMLAGAWLGVMVLRMAGPVACLITGAVALAVTMAGFVEAGRRAKQAAEYRRAKQAAEYPFRPSPAGAGSASSAPSGGAPARVAPAGRAPAGRAPAGRAPAGETPGAATAGGTPRAAGAGRPASAGPAPAESRVRLSADRTWVREA